VIKPFRGIMPKIHPDAFVSEAAYVVGDVEIGAGSSVWPGSIVRGDSGKVVIGKNTCVQDNSVVHSDDLGATIGDNVVIGHRVVCHADKVGDNCVLGNGCVVNGGRAEVGNNCVIAAGAVVLEKTKVPDNSFVVGIPGVVKGTVTEEQLKRFKRNADHYVELGQEYKKDGNLE
jgi:carbonic anhydrase/acetyltransferase-like protein (isoleucine patch superfamily)